MLLMQYCFGSDGTAERHRLRAMTGIGETGGTMSLLLAFAPFIVFAIVDRLVGSTEGLIAAAAVSAGILLRDWLTPNRSPKVLEIGTFILFGGLALYSVLAHPTWSVFGVRLCVDGGLLLVVLITMVIRRPFTLQYAREKVAKELWDSPGFLRTNYVITCAWAVAFLIMAVADAILVYMPEWPPRIGIIATIVVLVGAVKFTGWYPEHRRAAASRSG